MIRLFLDPQTALEIKADFKVGAVEHQVALHRNGIGPGARGVLDVEIAEQLVLLPPHLRFIGRFEMIADKARAITEVVGKTEAEGNLPLRAKGPIFALQPDRLGLKAPAKFWKRSVSSRFTSKREARKAPERLAMRSQCFPISHLKPLPKRSPKLFEDEYMSIPEDRTVTWLPAPKRMRLPWPYSTW